jgi:adenine-specific DNA glycosylase
MTEDLVLPTARCYVFEAAAMDLGAWGCTPTADRCGHGPAGRACEDHRGSLEHARRPEGES